jgi:hypothetical protein
LASALAPAEQRVDPLVAIFRCMLVSSAVEHRVSGMNNTVGERAEALTRLTKGLGEPQRTRARECAVDLILSPDLTELDVWVRDVIVPLASQLEGKRRDIIVERVIGWWRAEGAREGVSTWILCIAPLLSAEERRTLCDEVTGRLNKVEEYDAVRLREALGAVPSMAPELLSAISSLSGLDRFRFACALVPHLDGGSRQHITEEIVATVEAARFHISMGDLLDAPRALDVEQLVRLWHALRKRPYGDHDARVCLRPLFALGAASVAESLAGASFGAMPYEWVLALAVDAGDRQPELRAELASRLAALEEFALGWAIDRDAADLVRVFGIDEMVRLARTISPDEERIVARLALVPLAPEADKRALVAEAVQTFRDSKAGGPSHGWELLACWEWMSLSDVCYLLVQVPEHPAEMAYCHDDLGPLLRRLGGDELPGKVAEQIVEVSRWRGGC